MKTKSSVQRLEVAGGAFYVLCAAILFLAISAAHAASTAELLEQGIYLEETKGEPAAAAQIYQQIIDDSAADRSVVAQAQLRLGLCQLKLGNKPQAISALERLTRDFPEKDLLLDTLDNHMPQLLDEMIKQIEQNYVLEVDRSELIETALRAIVGKLDSAGARTNDSAFISAREMPELKINVEQKLHGIGVVLRPDPANGEVIAQELLPGSPAARGGLRAGDRILKIDGAATPTNNLSKVVDLLRGPAGTTVRVTVKRADSPELLEFELVRDIIRIPSVRGYRFLPDQTWDYMLDDRANVGYVRVTQFGEETSGDVRAALNDLKARGMKALILDLRDNPGGTLDSAIAVSDLFLVAGRIVTVKGRSSEQVYDATDDDAVPGVPIAVLVNRNTASAAEIVAACLQDHHRATLVGERTFGQGLVRTLIQLKDGVGALKLPVGAFYRPSGKNMNRYPASKDSDDWGVQPDAGYELLLESDEWKQYEKWRAESNRVSPGVPGGNFQDRQLQKARESVLGKSGP